MAGEPAKHLIRLVPRNLLPSGLSPLISNRQTVRREGSVMELLGHRLWCGILTHSYPSELALAVFDLDTRARATETKEGRLLVRIGHYPRSFKLGRFHTKDLGTRRRGGTEIVEKWSTNVIPN